MSSMVLSDKKHAKLIASTSIEMFSLLVLGTHHILLPLTTYNIVTTMQINVNVIGFPGDRMFAVAMSYARD